MNYSICQKKAKTKKTRTIKVTNLLVVHLNLQGVLKALLQARQLLLPPCPPPRVGSSLMGNNVKSLLRAQGGHHCVWGGGRWEEGSEWKKKRTGGG